MSHSFVEDVPNEPEVGPQKARSPLRGVRRFILFCLLVPSSVLTYLAVSSGSSGDVRDRRVAFATASTITGPFVGAIARKGQSCCVENSIALATVAGPILVLCLIAQAVPIRPRRVERATRLILWTGGWIIWLFAGHVSLLHALF